MSQPLEVIQTPVLGHGEIEKVLIGGDLAQMKAEHRIEYYSRVCASLGLNPLTQPFAYLSLSGKLTLYARKDAAEQLRSVRAISLKITSREVIDGMYVVTCEAAIPGGRCDMATGVVDLTKVSGEAKANAMMKAETKAKRRVTLSICGLGLMDESEVETVPGARKVSVDDAHAGKLLPAPEEKGGVNSERRPSGSSAPRAKGAGSDGAPAPRTSHPPEGASVDDLMPPKREVPEELRDAVSKLRAGDFWVSRITWKFLEDEMITAAGEAGADSFKRTTARLRERFPKGTAIPTEDMVNCWLDLWEDLEGARRHKAASDFVDGIGDPREDTTVESTK